ncbi:MAG: GntR family transcriptional regulator [Owenweeksia sp.]
MEFKDNQAIYLQIADLFCEKILMGQWQPEDRIPSVREMAVYTEVNPNTVMRTFTYLQEKGIIFNKRGIGYFVSEDGFDKTKALRKNDFIGQELPRLFREMELLNISLDDLSAYYHQFTLDQANENQ